MGLLREIGIHTGLVAVTLCVVLCIRMYGKSIPFVREWLEAEEREWACHMTYFHPDEVNYEGDPCRGSVYGRRW